MKKKNGGAQVYEDVPLEMFRDPLPPWPYGDTVSYSRDRSAGTRGVGAVAARDLREGGGGAVVRTGRGVVTLTPSAEKRTSRWGGPLPFGSVVDNRTKKPVVHDNRKPPKPKTGLVRPAFKDFARSTNTGKAVIVPTRGVIVVPPGPQHNAVSPVSPSGAAVNYGSSSKPVASSGGGSASYGGGGSSSASVEEIEEIVETPAEPPKGMSTAVKVAAVLGIGWAVLTMMKGGD